jgi:hypothetical protein
MLDNEFRRIYAVFALKSKFVFCSVTRPFAYEYDPPSVTDPASTRFVIVDPLPEKLDGLLVSTYATSPDDTTLAPALGLLDGVLVGFVGVLLGTADGSLDGFPDGTAVGRLLGFVGVDDGTLVGFVGADDGVPVGTLDGSPLGRTLGTDVGFVGALLGTLVGSMLGLIVAASPVTAS